MKSLKIKEVKEFVKNFVNQVNQVYADGRDAQVVCYKDKFKNIVVKVKVEVNLLWNTYDYPLWAYLSSDDDFTKLKAQAEVSLNKLKVERALQLEQENRFKQKEDLKERLRTCKQEDEDEIKKLLISLSSSKTAEKRARKQINKILTNK